MKIFLFFNAIVLLSGCFNRVQYISNSQMSITGEYSNTCSNPNGEFVKSVSRKLHITHQKIEEIITRYSDNKCKEKFATVVIGDRYKRIKSPLSGVEMVFLEKSYRINTPYTEKALANLKSNLKDFKIRNKSAQINKATKYAFKDGFSDIRLFKSLNNQVCTKSVTLKEFKADEFENSSFYCYGKTNKSPNN